MRTKEFLSTRGVEYESINVHADAAGRAALARLGARTVPVVARGDRHVNGVRLEAVAAFLGIPAPGGPQLAPDALVERLDRILRAAGRFLRQLPEHRLSSKLPNRDRTYRVLGHHVFRLVEAFLEAAAGNELSAEALVSPPPDGMRGGDGIARYGESVRRRLLAWWGSAGDAACQAPVRTYYGSQPLHELLERTTWHAGQHVRQLMMALELLGIEPDRPLTAADFAGLPMPEKVWDE